MLPTPSTSHVSYDLIYEPAEDSYLFLDTLSSASEAAWLHSRFSSAAAAAEAESEEGERGTTEDRQTTTPTTTTTGTRTRTKAKAKANNAATATPLLVEVGPGSGVVVAFLAAHAPAIFDRAVLALGVDVNPYACRAARTTADKALAETHGGSGDAQQPQQPLDPDGGRRRERSVYLASLNGDLAAPLRPGEVDVLVFNPPYVPTESVPAPPPPPPITSTTSTTPASTTTSPRTSTTAAPPPPPLFSSPRPTFEDQSHLLALSYAGGRDGMEVTARLLRQIPEALSPRGVAYVLFCRGNRPDEVKDWIRGWEAHEEHHRREQQQQQQPPQHPRVGGRQRQRRWRAETVGTSGKTAGWERLEVVRIWREYLE